MKHLIAEEVRPAIAATPIRLLLVEDSPNDVELALSELKAAGFCTEPTVAGNKAEFLSVYKKNRFDAVISDFELRSWAGLEALKEIRASGDDVPFLLVSGTLGEEAAVECIKQGVSDYVLKDHMSRLPVVLQRSIEERALREDLRKSEARNRDLVANSIYGICRASIDGNFLDVNAALLTMLGMEGVEDLNELNLVRDVFRFPEQFVKLMASCRDNGPIAGAETEWRRRDGGIVAVRLHVRRLSLPGEPESVELIAEDVTELRAMERQLRQAQKFEAIGQLAGGIAHDFNNVVGAILGWAELGYDQNRANPTAAERFLRIKEQAERAASLTRELLAFARRQVLQPRAVDLNTVTSGLISFLDRVIGKDIELKVVTSALEPVKADPTQVEQVLMSLCLNARDAMPGGGRMIIETEMVELDDSYCRFYPYVAPGRYAVLSVSDTGIGMDTETRERIFEPFFTTKGQGKGTGMGLATAYGIVKQHGGFIHVYSEPGQGSLFRLYFPAIEGVIADGMKTAASAPSRQEVRGSETILIAEDHESIREMARQALITLGYKVLAAANGEEALELCKYEKPDLAILDVVMPKVGGPAAAAKLIERFEGLPIVFASGYSQNSETLAGTDPNARYLQKPYSPTALGRVIREVLDAPH
jgi:two-component system, cell cycle sensor histidine kinase and response regulator CckA